MSLWWLLGYPAASVLACLLISGGIALSEHQGQRPRAHQVATGAGYRVHSPSCWCRR